VDFSAMKKTLSPRRRYGGVLLVLLLFCSLAAGCAKPKGSISGKVTYQGKPLTTGFVTFTPEKGPAVTSPIDGEGNYRVEKVPVGAAKISVTAVSGTNTESLRKVSNPKDPKEMMKALKPESTGLKIPLTYNDPDQSGLTYTVQQGPQEHDIQLK